MAIEGKEVMLHIKKVLVYSIRTSYKSVQDHPFIFSVVCFMLILYKSFPSLFAFLVSSSPVLICTALLLGTLLSFGEPHIPKIEEVDKRTQEISSLKVGSSASDLVVREDESCMVETHVETQREIEEMAIKEAVLGEKGVSPCCEVEENIPFATIHDEVHEGDERDDSLAASSSAKEDEKGIHGEEIVAEERELHKQEIAKKKEFSVQNVAERGLKVSKDIDGFTTMDQIENEGLKVEINKPALDGYFDSSLGSPWLHIDIHDASLDSGSDEAESSSPDASMADIIPMLDELHPLLVSETQPALLSKGSMDGASQGSSHDHESNDDGVEEEAENQEDEEDEEAQEEKDDGADAAVTWTEDDQKNVMDLGSSELERNQRLESLIAKRRAKKDLRFETERNLIDLDGSMKELSCFHVQIPPISAPRRNPFDLPYDSEEPMGLPQIPGSAPSVLLPRRNPFDFPYDPVDVSSSRTVETWRHRDFVSDPQRDMFSRRNETFNLGDTEVKQEKQESRLKPYFAVERTDLEETDSAALQRQVSDKSNSKVSSVPDSDTDSSVTDQEYHKELVEQELYQEGSPSEHDAEPVEQKTRFSKEAESMKVEQEKSEINIASDRGTQIHANIVLDETRQAAESFGAVEEAIRDEAGTIPTISVAEKLEVIEEKYEQSSPSTSEGDEKTRDAMLAADDSHCLSGAERADDSHVAGPIYDSSPQAIKKSLSNISEASSDSGKGDPDASSLKFEIQHVGSSPRPVERNVDSGIRSTGEELLASSTRGLWVASSKLVSEYESRSGKITELREPEVIDIGSQPVHKNASDLIAPVLSEPAATDIMYQSRINVDVSHQTEGNEMFDTAMSSYSDSLLLSDHLISSALERAQSTEKSGMEPSSEVGVEESQISILDLPPIPEENLDDDKPEEEHENLTKPVSCVGLTGSQILEEPRIVLSDIEQELSLLQRKSAEESDMDGNCRLAHEPEDVNPRVVSPVSIHDGSFTGLELLEPKEGMDFSILSEAKSELDTKSSTVLTDLRDDIVNAVPREREGYSQQNINDSDEESDKIHPDVINIRGIDENLLSELDVVGDFHVEGLRSDQQGPELGQSDDITTSCLTSEMHEITSKLLVSEVRSTEHADISLNLFSEANLNPFEELHSVIDQPKSVESEVGSSCGSSFVNPEQVVYNPRLHLLEASYMEIDLVFKQVHEEAGVPSASEPIVGKSKTMTSEVSASELVITERDTEQTIADSGMLILEAKSVEDINSAFNKITEGSLGKSIVPEVGPSQILPGGLHFEPMEIHSDLQIVEANSFEDIHLAFKQASDGIYDNPPKVTKPNVGSTEVEISDRHLEPDVLEVRSSEEIKLAFKEAVSKEAVSSKQQNAGKSGAVEKVDDDSSSNASTSKKTKKKNKSAKSGSSSSSSSSSSDSD
ncbi:uncharacterized protein [Elaeis guineensis]|uniref:Uncharacterized protein LOC105032086 n=1 Tax=Elaeis guineensis var. tenera TaxID=51953 RepID=A0A6I9Q7R6_ELAGV|nr:uncharacterized protein LOC105032086 [Elaeis guineensis]XP_010904741.1 uncharacterized protein LOC105032086 [Elaeis guineensis]XP_029116731.1 uncharacterized protein LOC105032086 [Elaeis guineensis]